MLIIIISETVIIPKSRDSLEGFSPSLEDGDQLHNLSMAEPSLPPDTQNPHSRSLWRSQSLPWPYSFSAKPPGISQISALPVISYK